MKECKINDYITLELFGDETIIYVSGKMFRQCKFVLLNIAPERLEEINEINSIDELKSLADDFREKENFKITNAFLNIKAPMDTKEAAAFLYSEMTKNRPNIPPETAFWVHCSNLQAWAENNYDTRLLHSNLAFPLLKKLAKKGDLTAKRALKEEITKRLESGFLATLEFLKEEGYFEYLEHDELVMALLNMEEASALLELERLTNVKLNLYLENEPEYYIEKYENDYTNIIIKDKSVMKLGLRNVGLKEIPACITKFKSLKELDLGNNNIKNISIIRELKNLKILSLGGNQIKEIPNWVYELPSLEALGISKNPIERPPDFNGKFSNIKILSLMDCDLKEIPYSLFRLPNLEYIYLEHNYIKDNIEEKLKNEKDIWSEGKDDICQFKGYLKSKKGIWIKY